MTDPISIAEDPMPRPIFAAVLAAACSLPLALAPVGWAQAIAGDKVDNDARQATARFLSRSITIDLTDSRLEDVMTFLRDYSGADIQPIWTDADPAGAGLDKEQRISISVKDVSVLTLLERVLEKARTDFSPATWQFAREGGAVEVGPRAALNKHAYLRIYDVQDMLFQIPDFPNAPELDLDQVLNQAGQQGGGGGGGSVFGDTEDGPLSTRSEKELADELITIITENVETTQWQDNGGDGATIRFYNGALIVRGPDYIHRQLGAYPFDVKKLTSRVPAPTPGSTPGAAAAAPARP
jgi:hypothetical protein